MLYGPEWGWNCSRKRGSIILKIDMVGAKPDKKQINVQRDDY